MSQFVKAIGSGSTPPEDGGWGRWVSEIRYTWVLALLLAVAPAVIFGAIFPAGFLMMALVVLGLPTGLVALLVKDQAWKRRIWRRLGVMIAVAGFTVAVVNQTDKLTPWMAAPIVHAIEQFKSETGSYPRSLTDLSPKHLERFPIVRVAIVQPSVSYDLSEGHAKLNIPSATGDAYSIFEYDFDAKLWHHLD